LMSTHASKPVMIIPNPQAAKTLGMLSIVFASLILFCDTCTGFSTAFGQVFARVMDVNMRGMQRSVDSVWKREERDLKKREAAAKTPEEKAKAQNDLARFQRQPRPIIQTTSVSASMNQFKDPVMATVTWTSLATAMILNSLMLDGGIGLLLLAEWGRKLSIWTAGLKVARLFLLVVITFVVIMPKTMALQRAQFREIEAKQKEAAGGRQVAGPDMGMIGNMAIASSYASVLSYYLVAPIFPIILLIALNRRRVRAAFYRPKTLREDELS
jgi:hypothetical protein